MVIMFCAFEDSPLIVRLHGTGKVVTPGDDDYEALANLFPPNPGMRSVIRLTVTRIAESCGMAVPLLSYKDERGDLDEWAEGKGPQKLTEYRQKKNAASIDGLPALEST